MTRALKLMQRAADDGHTMAQYHAGKMLLVGLGSTKKLKKAASYFAAVAEKKLPEGMAAYGHVLENGLGVSKDVELAEHYYEEAALLNDCFGLNGLGRFLVARKEYEKAAECFRKAADQGFASAQNNYGRMLENGLGLAQNLGEALRYYKLAADQGDRLGCVNLGLMYENGKGCSRDLVRAVAYFKKAADGNDSEGQFHYGRVLSAGIGVKKDLKGAAVFFRRSANEGNARAQFHLARMLEFGQGVPIDIDDAKRLYTRAAQSGHALAEQALARLKKESEGR
jgi:TPR repeat protein